jgi:aryl-alcohol dehydrogenase-like predicted oxidoreductase
MEYRDFGATGLRVSALGFGCWEMSGQYGDVEEQALTTAVHAAIDRGVNCFDTAPAYGYGRSEQVLGRAIGDRRKDVLVVTKCGIGYPDRPSRRDGRREAILASVDKSLQDLGMDYVDVLLIHWPDRDTPFEESMAALEEVVRAGKARFVGLSNFKLEEIQRCMAVRRVDVVQYGLNLFDRRMEQAIFPYCRENNIGVMVYGPLAYGLLAGAFSPETRFGDNDWRARGGLPQLMLRFFNAENFPRNLAVVDDLKAIAARQDKSVANLALAWVLGHPEVSTALVGTRTPDEVEKNQAAIGWQLDAASRAEIDRVFERHGVGTCPEFWLE